MARFQGIDYYELDSLLSEEERMARDTVREWVAGGAAIYVCGNAVGMGPAVHETLCAVLGDAVVAQLARDGRYRRDIY